MHPPRSPRPASAPPSPHRRARLWASLLAISAYASLGSEFGAWHPAWLATCLCVCTLWVFVFRHSARDLGSTFLAGLSAFLGFALGLSLSGVAVAYAGSLIVLGLQVGWVPIFLFRSMFE